MRPLTIGVLAPFLEGSYHGALLIGIQKIAHQHGVMCVAIQTTDLQEHGNSLPTAWNMIDGWIGIQEGAPAGYLQQIQRKQTPVVTISGELPGLACPTVMPDNMGGMAAAVRHLIEHGHRRIGFVGSLTQPDIQQRYDGYCAVLRAAGLAVEPELFFAASDHIETGGRVAGQRVLEAGVTCTALVAATDRNALGVMEVLQARGYHIPQDIALVGFDDLAVAQHTSPPLTSVRQQFDALGAKAAELLLQRLNGVDIAPGPVYVDTHFVQRFSCGCTEVQRPSIELTMQPGAKTWQQQLAHQLVAIACYPQPIPAASNVHDVWPSVQVVIDALEATLDGAPVPPGSAMHTAWLDVLALNQNHGLMLQGVLECIERTGKHRAAAQKDRHGALTRLVQLLEAMRRQQAYASQTASVQWAVALESQLQENFDINLALTDTVARAATQLQWLAHTHVEWGCLGLWTRGQAGTPSELEIVGVFGDGSTPPLGSRYHAEAFPPRQFLPESVQHGQQSVMILPLCTAAQAWGFLALVGSSETKYTSGRGNMSQWASLLSAAIERDHLIDVQAEQRESLRQSYERERRLADTVRALNCPLLPLRPGLLLVPLVGAIDSVRAQQFIELLLHGINVHRARVVLLDITGVPVVDTHVAGTFLQATQAATLLGARMVLVGVRPEIAQSIVSLGMDLRHIATEASLRAALDAFLHDGASTSGTTWARRATPHT